MHTMTSLRYILLNLGRGWLVVWMLVIPLIHIHPEIRHAHGAQDHIHKAQYHSLFSEEHTHEFHEHSHPAPLHLSKAFSESIESEHIFDHVFNHQEIGFSLLNKSGDDPLVPPGPGGVLVISDYPSLKIIRLLAGSDFSQGSPHTGLFDSQHRVRPPPSLSI